MQWWKDSFSNREGLLALSCGNGWNMIYLSPDEGAQPEVLVHLYPWDNYSICQDGARMALVDSKAYIFLKDTSFLIVDMKKKEVIPGPDHDRWGYFCMYEEIYSIG